MKKKTEDKIESEVEHRCFHCDIISLLEEREREGAPVDAGHLLSSLIQLAGQVIKDAPEEYRPMLFATSAMKLGEFSGAVSKITIENPVEGIECAPAGKTH